MKIIFNILIVFLTNFFIISCSGGSKYIGIDDSAKENTSSSSVEKKLSAPRIEISYVTLPSTSKKICDELLETGFTCNMYRLDELGTGTKVAFSSEDDGVTFYYTTDGNNPTNDSFLYVGTPFEIKNKTNINVVAQKGEMKSEVTSLNIDTPYGKTISNKLNWLTVGDGISGIFVLYEALQDLSGPDFSKQHFIMKIDDGNTTSGDGVSSEGIITFDGWIENNFYTSMGDYNIFGNKFFESKGTWQGILWTETVYEADVLNGNPYNISVTVK